VEKQLAALPRRGRPVPTSGPSVSLIRGLLLYLPFDRVDRTATPDAGPRGHHVRVQGATIARGRIGGGCQFDGRNDCLAVSDNANLNPTAAISIAAWIKADSWDGNARIVQKGAWNSQYRLLRENGVLTFHLAGVSDGEVGCETPGSGAWHHVAGVYDGKTIRLYLDGQERGSKTASGRIAVTRDLLYVATRTSNAIQTDHFKGILDELRIYDRALSVREVELLSQAGGEKRTE
jgi:hypothetical protein